VPFIRQTRDKRGIECLYVMHAYRQAPAGPQRTRVLYIFRSPSHVKIGRRPLDPEVMEALEHTHPDLAFDWSTLHRESVSARTDAREREPRRDRQRGSNGDSRQRPAPVPQASPSAANKVEPGPPQPPDQSRLARTLGAATAARLRARFEELQLRVARRSRTPEERDRLTGRLQRLNPDTWADEGAIQAGAVEIDAQLDAILAELPARRRGRRGGRGRAPGVIMAGDASSTTGSQHASMDDWNRASGDPGDGGAVGSAAADPDAGVQSED
jgi:hypothetical protein